MGQGEESEREKMRRRKKEEKKYEMEALNDERDVPGSTRSA